ncbi:MAG TPA: hypoxanthine phosphoribosyltransferase [Tenuifilaceae bacterium]|nr:hypoxanthine phosphoribosyltransferase [Tenuifilaceae bacterium]HPE19453.1 hypoxanthine phosphoribosyltransferase [Tenuifilaceae bacterium]HPJ47037.1 hypoxanthine phosphoribosyltransferase [Tenuifilaceae bacterium]HPQ35542.1 hypoxanthine phosphoribosyltransferase [Tenuifilaceae bacterium]HRX69269.1 hypoxanthine phosphoribosyltransferase [Tenuifilaceae bacterium]
MKTVKLWDKEFRLSYPASEISSDIKKLADLLNKDLAKEENPLFLSVLNGSFIFTADLIRLITVPCEISFVKLSSYEGTSTTGTVNQLIGLTENIENRTVIILEDIVDTGITLGKLIETLKQKKPKSIKVATLLFKPQSYKGEIKIDYVGKSIPNDFIVGYGLDYDGIGRNLADIYTLV